MERAIRRLKRISNGGKNVGLNTRGNDRAERFEEDPSGVRFQDTLLWLASPISRAITRRGATHRP